MPCSKCGVVYPPDVSFEERAAHEAGCSGIFKYKYIHRFIGMEEMKHINQIRQKTAADSGINKLTAPPDKHVRDKWGPVLSAQMNAFVNNTGMGNALQQHTMTRFGGGRIGQGQPLVSFATSVEKLVASTDPSVQTICKSAPYIITILVPNDSCLPGASDLSKKETEVVVCNAIEPLAMLLAKVTPNPYTSS